MNLSDAPTRGMTPEELRRALEARGHRFTAQRAAVYRVLSGTTAHPTADDVFTCVRQHIPDISLATVYKALEAFVTCGVARKLSLGAGPARYDGRTDEHEHIRCLSCGRVQDIEGLRPRDWMQGLSEMTPFDVVGYRLELEGYCPDCLH
ncbi:Fur family transcriptional regulator [Candidatus Palauibacter sp.]|uniref:Fur family transcriptional regulator n=1 Tax=Candidatus Palauibacter sp. TaxID=3101350 RepID=UPI003B0192AF